MLVNNQGNSFGMVPSSHIRAQPSHLQAAQASTFYVYSILGNVALVLGVAGFPIVAATADILNFSNNSLSIAYRYAYLALCGTLMFMSIGRRRYRPDILIIVFFVAYSVRMFVDFQYSTFSTIENDALFFVAVTLLPTICLGGGRDWYREPQALWLMVLLGTIGNLLILYALRTMPITSAVETRASLYSLNPISIGYNGLFTGGAAILMLIQRPSWKWTVLLCLCALLSLYIMVSSASRGPLVALLLAMAVTSISSSKARALYIVLTVVGIAAIVYFGVPDLILNRLQSSGSDNSSLERVYALQFSIEEAVANPLFGYAYIEPVTGLYPHNMLLEAALATGVIGFVLMLWMMISLLQKAVLISSRSEMLLPFIAMTQLANAWISGSLWGSSLFYLMVWLLRDPRFAPMSARLHRPG